MKPDYIISNGINTDNKRFLTNINPFVWGTSNKCKRFKKFKLASKILNKIKRDFCPGAKLIRINQSTKKYPERNYEKFNRIFVPLDLNY